MIQYELLKSWKDGTVFWEFYHKRKLVYMIDGGTLVFMRYPQLDMKHLMKNTFGKNINIKNENWIIHNSNIVSLLP